MKRQTTINQQWKGPGWNIGLAVTIDDAVGSQVAAAGHVVEAIERFINYHLPDARVVPASPASAEPTGDEP